MASRGTAQPTDMPRRGGVFTSLPATCALGVALMCVFAGVSLLYGTKPIPAASIWRALVAFDPDRAADLIIREIRLPRVVMGAMVGAAFALAGAVMQALTRNPLASPSLTGINAGGSLFLVIALINMPDLDVLRAAAVSFVGACVGVALVYGIASASPRGMTPVRLAIAGLMVSAVLQAFSGMLANYFMLRFELLYWTMGGFSNVRWSQILTVLPVFVVCTVGILAMAPQLSIMMLGRDTASSLGVRVSFVRTLGMALVLLLTGSAIAVAGPIGFVGLIVPHMSRALVGFDYRRVLPVSAAIGCGLVVLPDILCRRFGDGFMPVGVYTALIGAVCFVIINRRVVHRSAV